MPLHGAGYSFAAIEHRVREVVTQERTLTFTALTTTLPDCLWISLLRVLNHLKKRRVIQLIPLPWDYQICVITSAPPAPRTD